MKRFLVGLVVVLAACPSKAPQTTGTGSGTPTTGSGSADTSMCDRLQEKVAGLYHAEAATQEPERVDQATADNTAMVLGECRRDPGRVAPCVQKASTVTEIEKQCLSPLDEEGTEGEALRK